MELNRRAAVGLAAAVAAAGAATAQDAGPRGPRRVLAYGASSVWGFLPLPSPQGPIRRLSSRARWTGVAQRALGDRFELLEDALPGRTAGVDRALTSGGGLSAAEFNGLRTLPATLVKAAPLDLVALMLGANDLLLDPAPPAEAVAERLIALVEMIRAFRLPLPLEGMAAPPKALVIAPQRFGPIPTQPNWRAAEDARARLSDLLAAAAPSAGFTVVDAAAVIGAPGADGLHFGAEGHRALGRAAAAAIRTALA